MTALLNHLLYDPRDPRDLAMLAVILFGTLAAAAWIGFCFRERTASLTKVVERHEAEINALRSHAMIDELTGLLNGRALHKVVLPSAVRNVVATRKPIAVAFADLDGFKQMNTKLGHDGADRVLKGAAAQIEATLKRGRATDQVFRRNGGDEFVIVLPGADIQAAGRILRDVLGDLRNLSVPASIGCVVAHAGNLPSPAELLRQADEEMRRVKMSGKGAVRVVAAVTTAEHDRPALLPGGAA